MKPITKSEKTSRFIIEKTAPIFNKNGYSATSMSDIVNATKLTKGAIYGNFKNKEEVALASFEYNIRFIITKIKNIVITINSPIAKLYAITNFYRNHYTHIVHFGGCPILNVGVDANHTNPKLFKRVKEVVIKIQNNISTIIKEGQAQNEIKKEVDALLYGSRIFSLIEGALFTSIILKEEKYLLDMMNHLDHIIKIELQNISV
ncbi:MAG: TetR/AcrR family transcriptional regulator [Flavobacteriaceae bacterium]|nr:TetR/AcrR family transcriptional regulator [Flavobacteriaceae bacterium]